MSAPVTFRRYRLPSINGEGWAIVVLGSDGYFSTVSDFGNYAFRWACHGMPDFRLFMLRVEADYVAGKLTHGHGHYFSERTLKCVREHLLAYRREGTYSKEFARREWDRLEEHDNLYSEHDFSQWVAESLIPDAWDLGHYGPERAAVAWGERILPRLKEAIRAELAAETAARGEVSP